MTPRALRIGPLCALLAACSLAPLPALADPAAPPPPAPAAAPSLPYSVTLPEGFVALERVDKEWRVHGQTDRSWWARPEMTAMYFHEKLGITVSVSVLDPEVVKEASGEATTEAWARRIAARALNDVSLDTAQQRAKAHFTAWGTAATGRSVELHWRVSGCDDADELVRIAEHDGGVHVVRLDVPGTLKPKRIAGWREAFFDAPLGARPALEEQTAPSPKAAKHRRQTTRHRRR